MGCGVSKTTVVQPINPNELQREEDETASKHGGRGDSAVSKVTTDSGVVMESRDVLVLPGAVPRKLPPLSAAGPGLLQQGSPGIERLKSSEILEQLLSQGILLVGERNSKAGEAYNIMLDDKELPRRRPPARLESLKVRKEQSPTSREAIDHKMRLAEERRMMSKDDLKSRLRAKSARVRVPTFTSSTLKETGSISPVVQVLKPLTPDDPLLDPSPHTQVIATPRGIAEGGERVREDGGDGREGGGVSWEAGEEGRREGGEGRREYRKEWREDGERAKGDGSGLKEEEVSRVEEVKAAQLLTASGEFEMDSTFQHTQHAGEMF